MTDENIDKTPRRVSDSSHESMNTYSTVQGGPIFIDLNSDDDIALETSEKIDELYEGLSEVVESLTKENIVLIDRLNIMDKKINDLTFDIERLSSVNKEMQKQLLMYQSRMMQILSKEIESNKKFKLEIDSLIKYLVANEIKNKLS